MHELQCDAVMGAVLAFFDLHEIARNVTLEWLKWSVNFEKYKIDTGIINTPVEMYFHENVTRQYNNKLVTKTLTIVKLEQG